MNIQNKSIVVAIALVSALSIAGCGKSEDKGPKPEAKTTAGTEIDDSTITTKVKSALMADSAVKSSDIKVETRKGEVQLSGFVDNQTQMDRALTVAKGVEGVKSVDNKMNIKSTGPSTTAGDKIDDAVITTKVKATLLADSIVKGTDIGVVTNNGEVQLSGFVDNQAQIDRATELTRGIEGVKNVINEMSVKK